MSLRLNDSPRASARAADRCAASAGGESGARWYVAETIQRKEALALEHLRRQGFRGFCPRLRKTRSHARKREQVLVPLFPSYVFVRLDAERRPWRAVNGTLGVKHLLGSERGLPHPMPEAAMDGILARCDDGIVARLIDQPEQGQAVRILTGPFADSLATIEALDDRGRVSVLLDILGGRTSVRLTIDSLAPVRERS